MRSVLWLALGFALVFPTVMAWIYFMALPGEEAEPSATLQTVYWASKAVQFAFPIACLLLIDRRLPRPTAPTRDGQLMGLGFGLLVAGGMLALYYGVLRNTPFFAEVTTRFRRDLAQQGLASAGGFALLALVITVIHSFLEEYYWRWFAFDWLTRLTPPIRANLLSSTAFAAYHVVLLEGFFRGYFFLATLPFALCTGLGGVFWAWLYERTGSIYAPWLSHMVVDAGLFVVGYDIYFVMGTA